jgi:ribonuclease HI
LLIHKTGLAKNYIDFKSHFFLGWIYTPDCFKTWAQKEHKHMHLPSIICWMIWLERNNTIFENGTPSSTAAAYKALGIYNSWNDSLAKKTRLQRILKAPKLDDVPTAWFDGAARTNGSLSGAGGLIKTTHNTFYKWTFNCGPGTNTREELLGAWATLYLASRLYIESLQVLGDSSIVIDWLSGRGELQAITLLAWKDRIRLLQPSFKKISYKHIYREHNKTVDLLSKAALQERVGFITYHLWIDGHEGPPHFLSLC